MNPFNHAVTILVEFVYDIQKQPDSQQTPINKQIRFFQTELPQWDIDIQLLNDAPLDFCFAAIRGQLLYAKSEEERVHYETEIITQYLDFKPFLEDYLKIQKQKLLGDLTG
ncbi:MAG: hypothetical protein ACE5R6_20555 [Candidatus Heimdallarchaeota archaeon]